MHDRPDLRSLGPLLASVVLAEEISRDVAAAQAALAPPPLRAVLHKQSRQERAHAALFRAALACVPGHAAAPPAVAAALARYEAQLRADVARGALLPTLVGLQCVLEALAEVALEPPDGLLRTRADDLVPLRAFVLHQEQAHRRLGEVWVPRLAVPDDPGEEIRRAGDRYVALGLDVLDAGLAQLDCLRADRAHYARAVPAHLEGVRARLCAGGLAARGRPDADAGGVLDVRSRRDGR